MIRALNFKSYEKGSMRGFFDLGYGGLVVKGCRLMDGKNGLWLAMPSKQIKKDGETIYLDIVEMAKSDAEQVRKTILSDLRQQGHLDGKAQNPRPARSYQRPEQEDLSEYYPQGGGDEDIPF